MEIPFVTDAKLNSMAGVLELYREFQHRGLLDKSLSDLVDFLSLAVHCRKGERPGALFHSLFHNQDFSTITAEEEEEAWREFKAFTGRSKEPTYNVGCQAIGECLCEIFEQRESKKHKGRKPEEEKKIDPCFFSEESCFITSPIR